MKLRHFYRIDQNTKQPIPGSNMKRKSSPGKFWKEILDPCCSPTTIDCTCGPRFFIQIDGLGKPIPGSLIKRFLFPKMEQGIRYVEINWKSVCCNNITWDFNAEDSTGELTITVNGYPKVSSTITSDGVFKPNFGDTIEITVQNDGINPSNVINVGGVVVYSASEINSVYSFIWDGSQTHISATITSTPD